MKLLINIEELNNYKSRDKIPLECEYCHNTFYMPKNQIQCIFSEKSHSNGKFCSRKCSQLSQFKRQDVTCKQCNKPFKKKFTEVKRSNNHFCSKSCSGLYWSQHKTTGCNRSKLETWLEKQLTNIYPNLLINYNEKETINGELDIYIPSLKLAFELNGIFHYEDIFGQLEKTQNNDKRKFAACNEKGIGLCVIDTSKQRYFKEKSSQQFLDIITTIINNKLAVG